MKFRISGSNDLELGGQFRNVSWRRSIPYHCPAGIYLFKVNNVTPEHGVKCPSGLRRCNQTGMILVQISLGIPSVLGTQTRYEASGDLLVDNIAKNLLISIGLVRLSPR